MRGVPRILPLQLLFLSRASIQIASALIPRQRCENYGTSPTSPIDSISNRQCKHHYPRGSPATYSFGLPTFALSGSKTNEDGQAPKNKTGKKKKMRAKKTSTTSLSPVSSAASAAAKEEEKAKKKKEIMEQLRSKLAEKNQANLDQGKKQGDKGGLLDKLNPFQAGQSLRQTLGTLTSLGSGLNQETRQKYYLDDRFLESGGGGLSERNPYLERQDDDTFVPEVLVIGATGEIGRLVVRRLLLEGRFRVRVLVRDLYSQTLNLLGTGVTYCQGDLGNMESLEYALTDVDKIVFCASAPRPDERDFQEKFEYFLKENLNSKVEDLVENEDNKEHKTPESDVEWEQLSSILEVRAQLAEQVDSIGMQNLVRAYQNVRHADYGTSQAAKRSVFKFSSRPGDFGLFSLDEETVDFLATKMVEEEEGGDDDGDDGDDGDTGAALDTANSEGGDYGDGDQYGEYDYSEYDDDDYLDDDEYYEDVEARRDATVKSQIQWIRNEFGHGVFVGKVPKADSAGVGGEAAIVSSRLRSRDDPEGGIDLSGGFAGFIVRLVGDGSNYEAFVRTEAYEKMGIEYVCEFSTATKPTTRERKSRNKFITVRLSFDNFRPVLQKEVSDDRVVPPFDGSDVRHIGFRYRSASNPKQNKLQDGDNVSFYIALSYVKVYRQQPEPEFVYLSDARIPPVVPSGMVRHDQRRLVVKESSTDTSEKSGDIVKILDQKTLQTVNTLERSPEETYFKFRGEEILKSSGLSYTIVRVAGYNESPSGEASTIDLSSTNCNVSPISRAEAAQVCVSALLDPHALNKSIYTGKRQKGTARDEDMSTKFAALPNDPAKG